MQAGGFENEKNERLNDEHIPLKKRRRKNTKEVTLLPPGNPPNYKGKDRLSMKQHLHVTNMNK